jgi:hypothetical protein
MSAIVCTREVLKMLAIKFKDKINAYTIKIIMGEVPIILVSLTSTSEICRICIKKSHKLVTSLLHILTTVHCVP